MKIAKKWILRLITTIGILILIYPLVGNFMQQQYQKNAVATYQKELNEKSKVELEKEISKVEEYNTMLYQSSGAIIDNMDIGILSDESYQNLLNQSNGIMCSIEIPKIGVDLPVYHGTDEEVLSKGVGHQQGTSLPIGGENTHSVLSGHRGLPGSSLFTRLDEMKEGDLFFLKVMGEVLAYKVYEIQIIEPDQVDILNIQNGKDIVSLITCTPYGLNTHRLVVTGERVPYEKTDYERIEMNIPSYRELIFIALPIVVLLLIITMKFWNWRKNRYV